MHGFRHIDSGVHEMSSNVSDVYLFPFTGTHMIHSHAAKT